MWEESDLWDEDLRSVYGEAAVLLRLRTTIEALEQKYAAMAHEAHGQEA